MAWWSGVAARKLGNDSARGRHAHTLPVGQVHGSLEGVGGLKTNEAYHSKADALLIPKMLIF